MRLLKRAENGELSLTEFFDDSIPRYAILSHTWGKAGDEVSFEDLNKGSGRDKNGYHKILFCEKQAANDGLQYFWVDTCSIDKSSSSELTEAINSMWRWYSNAAKCYVYLSDVSDTYQPSLITWEADFRSSRWFTRGWTLQELIAPPLVEFFSLEGKRLGDKRSLEQQIHEITGINMQALRGDPLSEFSVAERLSWATDRKTTRKEDEAYSLLGIFDIHIPLIYGEGQKAMVRLKEEIDKSSNVHSRSEIQHWLSPSNVADDLHKHVEECMPGSCDWLLTRPYLQGFLSSASSAIGHIQGRPGAGKSTAAAFIIKHMLSYRGSIVLYFFCKDNDVEKRQPIHVLRTMLSQLLRADEKLYPVIGEIYLQSGRKIADSHTEIEAALVLAFENIKAPQTSIIIDALDECQNVPKLVESICKCMRSARSTTRVLITSRPMALGVLADHDVRVEDVRSTATFIEAYIAQRVNANINLRGTNLGTRVVSEVSRAADDLWLYARLMMDEIARLASSALIERQLQAIPHSLTQLYSQILRSSEKNFSAEQIRFAQQIFLWLDVDDYLPDFLYTNYEGLSYNTLCLILRYVNFGQPVFNPIALARELCSPLVEVHKISPPTISLPQDSSTEHSPVAPRDFELDYVHHTAKQYILESYVSPLIDIPLVLRPRRFRYFHRAAVAVWYFSECPESEEYLRSLRVDPRKHNWNQCYFDMAYGIWGALKLSEFEVRFSSDERLEVASILDKLSNFITSTKCLTWIETAIIVNYSAGYSHLLLNATEAFGAAKRTDTNGVTIWEDYQRIRLHFLSTYVYVLGLTGPPLLGNVVNYKRYKPTDFASDPLAREILTLGKHWQRKRRHM